MSNPVIDGCDYQKTVESGGLKWKPTEFGQAESVCGNFRIVKECNSHGGPDRHHWFLYKRCGFNDDGAADLAGPTYEWVPAAGELSHNRLLSQVKQVVRFLVKIMGGDA